MNIRLIREPSRNGATLGVLLVDGHFECFALEDQIREVPGQPVSTWKVPGTTAIPSGRYRIVVTHSPRFKRKLPLIVDVPGFDGVRFHAGNDADDSSGCILPGRTRGPATVGQSMAAFNDLFTQIQIAIERGEDVWLTIENPAREQAA